MKLTKFCKILVIPCLVLVAACEHGPVTDDKVRQQVYQALDVIGLDKQALSVPKLGRPYSTPGRLAAVDAAMKDPLSMLDLSRQLVAVEPRGDMSSYIMDVMDMYELEMGHDGRGNAIDTSVDEAVTKSSVDIQLPHNSLKQAIRMLLEEADLARQEYLANGGKPTEKELQEIHKHLETSIIYNGKDPEAHWLMPDAYHRIGARVDVAALATAMLRLLAVSEQAIAILQDAEYPGLPVEWETPQGKVRIAGKGNDVHSGDYLLLIDLGGDDQYLDVGRALKPGQVSIVIDMGGNDEIRWEKVAGPGSGVMGLGLWVDVSGDDIYQGRNMGVGAALLGAGILWDREGNDTYSGGAMVQGAGQYGVGILIDEGGDDNYRSELASQGFGGPGGYGIQLDFEGSDSYQCGGKFPDQAEARKKRHLADHYLGMCQGYSFGIRPKVSGGVGLLLDRDGDDSYAADMFAQGGALWFGLGMLVDRDGNDSYKAFEHAQGESLHLGAGYLGDWGGNDSYEGYEHCQGVGMDRAVGFLFDSEGDDTYRSNNESQGAGLKPYGVGLLVDESGNDWFITAKTSQGYSVRPGKKYPESQWPVGVLLDLGGDDTFQQPHVLPPSEGGRVINRQGVALIR